MMIFTDVQLIIMESHAKRLLTELKIDFGLQLPSGVFVVTTPEKDEWSVGKIMEQFKEFCSMGRSIALDEVCATPWEYAFTFVEADVACELGRTGWEPIMAISADGAGGHARVMWRRRKAVQECGRCRKGGE